MRNADADEALSRPVVWAVALLLIAAGWGWGYWVARSDTNAQAQMLCEKVKR